MGGFYIVHSQFIIMRILLPFFEGLGVALKEEDHGRMFPMSNRAQDVVDALIRQLQRLHVEVRLNTPVSKLLMDEEKNSWCSPCRRIRGP